jgi:hypothetical protein
VNVSDDSDSSRLVAENLSELINAVARLAYPERFGKGSDDDLSEGRRVVSQLREALDNFKGWASPGLDLKKLRAGLPALEHTLIPGQDTERLLAARDFLVIAVGAEFLGRLETGPEAVAVQRKVILWLTPWRAVADTEAAALLHELGRELHASHPLHRRTACVLGRCIDCDDVLYVLEEPYGLAVVHHTYAGTVPERPPFPATRFYATIDEFREECMLPDHRVYEGTT